MKNYVLYTAFTLFLAFAGCNPELNTGPADNPAPPVLSEGRADSATRSGAGAALIFTSDQPGTCYYLVLDAGDPAPDAAGVRARGAAKNAVAGPNALAVTGLTPETNYAAYIVVENTAALLSQVITLSGISPADFAITGSEWYLGRDRLVFQDGTALTHGKQYDFTYNAGNGTGAITGDISQTAHSHEGINVDSVINALGPFTITEDTLTLTFHNYRNSGFEVAFSKIPDPAAAENLLVGTAWSWGGNGLTLEFLPNGRVLQYSFGGYYPHPHIYPYTWDRAAQKGSIAGALRVCGYSTATTPLGPFRIMTLKGDGITRVYFDNYKSYGHDADYHKRPEG
ncbi:MAG: hypothetical protein LBQ35_05975 [Spirochaetaceae bacterium]|jgi:hypothetical protein|nr:hypothetical protein [Spirochaetaceae bacterium]